MSTSSFRIEYRPVRWRFVLIRTGVVLLSAAVLLALLVWQRPTGQDWQMFYRPVIRDCLLQGHSPYACSGLYNPPWLLLPLIPIALLPPGLDNVALFVLCLAAFGFVAHRLGASRLGIVALLLSPVVLNVTYNGQLDWLIALGLVLPRPLGLFLLLAKPQIGAGVALFWLFEEWHKRRLPGALRTFAPVTLAFLLSFMAYGFYPLNAATGAYNLLQPHSWNVTFWPWSLCIGCLLLREAIRRHQQATAILAAPFLSPYVAVYSWSMPLLGLARDTPAMVTVSLLLWIITRFLWHL